VIRCYLGRRVAGGMQRRSGRWRWRKWWHYGGGRATV